MNRTAVVYISARRGSGCLWTTWAGRRGGEKGDFGGSFSRDCENIFPVKVQRTRAQSVRDLILDLICDPVIFFLSLSLSLFVE